jgi:hypothetical protein
MGRFVLPTLTADRSTTELRWIVFFGTRIERHISCPRSLPRQVLLCRQSYDQSINPDAVGTLPLSYAGLSFAQRSGKLVAGAGFEPAVPRSRDYAPGRSRPVNR